MIDSTRPAPPWFGKSNATPAFVSVSHWKIHIIGKECEVFANFIWGLFYFVTLIGCVKSPLFNIGVESRTTLYGTICLLTGILRRFWPGFGIDFSVITETKTSTKVNVLCQHKLTKVKLLSHSSIRKQCRCQTVSNKTLRLQKLSYVIFVLNIRQEWLQTILTF